MDTIEHVALHVRGKKKVCLNINQRAMDEIESYVEYIGLPMAEIWYWRSVKESEEATICPCGLLSILNMVPLS